MDVNQRMKELAGYIRMNEELTTTIDTIKDELKEYMKKNGNGHGYVSHCASFRGRREFHCSSPILLLPWDTQPQASSPMRTISSSDQCTRSSDHQ